MSGIQTMRVGDLYLRKTDEGWQYLREGIGGDPDRWCDATSMIGPFGGSGVTSLLDDLLATRQATEEKAANVCKNCRFWGAVTEGCCDFIDTIDGTRVAQTTGCEIIVTALDDSGMYAELKTGPDFSCPHFRK